MEDNGLNDKTKFYQKRQDKHASPNGGEQGCNGKADSSFFAAHGYNEGTTDNEEMTDTIKDRPEDAPKTSEARPKNAQKIISNRYRIVEKIDGGIGMVYKCLSKNPEDRFASCQEFVDALEPGNEEAKKLNLVSEKLNAHLHD